MSIDISHPWARMSATRAGEAGGYFTVVNKGREPDRLIAAESPAVAKIEIHAIKVVGYGMTMRPLEKGLGLPPDTAITLKPRGYHLFMRVTAPLAEGQRVPVTLTFEKAGTRQIELVVEAPGLVGDHTLDKAYAG